MPERSPLFRTTQSLFFLLLLSLAFMQPSVKVMGLPVIATDLLYLPLFLLWAAGLYRHQIRLSWHRGFAATGFYFLALGVSALFSDDPERSAFKMATQAYLATLPLIACSLIETREDLRRAIYWWLGGSAIVALVGVASLVAFTIAPGHPLLAPMINEFGTLPPGQYPRLRLTYEYVSLLCNYLTVALMLLLAARQSGWAGRPAFIALLAGILIAAAFTLTPGLGGLLLALGSWLWTVNRDKRPLVARLGLAGGIGAAAAFLVAAAVTPILHATAPFLIHLPFTDVTLAPAVRMLTWLDAVRTFVAYPLVGRGIGLEAVSVIYQGPGGAMHHLTDAHNGFLNIAAQSGSIGLVAFLLLLGTIARQTLPLRLDDRGNGLKLALGLALLSALAWQGLVGSFEDARYLWILLGLFFAAARMEERSGPA